MGETPPLAPYVPRIASDWELDAPDRMWQRVDGSLVFVDISGFTALSERLARLGRIGAEELTNVLDQVFGDMLRAAYARGGSLLKFGGDALLLLFDEGDHVQQAVAAAVEMRASLRRAKEIKTSVGRVHLKMSVGVHTGAVDFFRVGVSHRELIVTGPTASITTEMEGAASGGQINVSPEVASHLPASWIGDQTGRGNLLRKQKIHLDPVGAVERRHDAGVEASVPVALRPQLSVGAEAEHRIATIGFVKFKGVDVLLANEGHDAVAEALDELVTATQEAVDAEGVTFLASDIDTDGGKLILATGVPASQADDEGRVLRAGRAILASKPRLKTMIGVNRGHVFSGDVGTDFRRTYTVMGDTVNLAARLMAAASPGEMYASPSVLGRAATLFRTEEVPPFHVKGKTEPVRAHRVHEETGSRPAEVVDLLPFRGRDEEVEKINGAVEACSAGSGSVFTLLGDTGVGKTRLLQETIGEPDFAARGEPTGRDTPFRAIRDAVRGVLGVERGTQESMRSQLENHLRESAPDLMSAAPLFGDLAFVDIPDNDQTSQIEAKFRAERAADALAALLETRGDRLTIVGEDLHWADEGSIAVMRTLANRAAENPWVVVWTMRDADGPDPVGETLPIELLDDDAALEIVHAATAATPLRPDDANRLVERAGGNPLFLGELVRIVRTTGSVEGLPDSLEGVVSAEIDALEPLPRSLLRTASVLGRSFRRVVLDAFLEPEPFSLDQATRRSLAHFLERDGTGRLKFSHAVVHDLAYSSLSYKRRRELHARAAEVMIEAAGGDTGPIAGILATHFEQSGDAERTWQYALTAADAAKAEYANVEAASQYRRALSASRDASPPSSDLAAAAESLGDVLEQAGYFGEAQQAFARAAQATTQTTSRALIAMKRARVHARVGSYSAAMRQTSTGVRLLEGTDGPDASVARSQLVAFAAGVRLQQGRPNLALAAAVEARDLAESSGDRDGLARALTVLDGALEMLGRHDEAVNADEARAIYEELADLPGVATVDNNVGVRAYDEGRWDDAVVAYRRAQEGLLRSGNRPSAALVGANIGEVLVSQCRLAEAESVLRDAIRDLRAAEFADLAVFAEIQLARLEISRGNLGLANGMLRRLRTEAQELGQRDIALEAAINLADGLNRLHDAEGALALLDEAEAEAGEEAALYEAGLMRLRAEASAKLGQKSKAFGLLKAALEAARDQGLIYEEALALSFEASVRGNEEALEEANRLLQGLGVVDVVGS